MNFYFHILQCGYLDIAALTGSTAFWNLEIIVVAYLQVVSLMGNYLPRTFYIGWEVLRIVWRLDCPYVCMDGASTAWQKANKKTHMDL